MARTYGSRAEITGPLVREAAARLFARHGYAAVSMRQIAAAVGVQVGTIYSYTPDKQSLLADLLRGHMDEVLTRWHDPVDLDPLARLDLFVRGHIATTLEHQELVFLSYMELRNLSAENFQAISALRHRYEDQLELILRDGHAAGVMTISDTRLATLALIAMLTGVANWYRDGGRIDREHLARIYCDLARGAVGA
ncbi:TetR/AcrR family transcriptional regulator [Paracoccus sp. (in: a-proteobacteria)]|uniref:TetR/AcrR family transcriptional regulator n=1 Tax=Paracoccus sp. TaxID=267 RepID=UPI00289BA2AB|nr:TetR/AcrR family transcriptional regulator [Paracoccus sp. (in: a-proteobacteria)]